MTERTITVEDLPAEFERLAAMATSPPHTNIWNSAADMLRAALSSDHQGGRGELEVIRERQDDCGVCGVPGTNRREVCEGYSVPRCDDHRDLRAYQAESRLDTLLSDQPPAPRGLSEAAQTAVEAIDSLFEHLTASGLMEEGGGLPLYEKGKVLADARAQLADALADQDGGN